MFKKKILATLLTTAVLLAAFFLTFTAAPRATHAASLGSSHVVVGEVALKKHKHGIKVSPNPVQADQSGGISFLISGHGLPPMMLFDLSSNIMGGCKSNTVDGSTATTDIEGTFVGGSLIETATGCIASRFSGTFEVFAREATSPFKSYEATFKVIAS